MSTRLAIEQEAVRRLGGKTGSITSGTATTAVLAGLLDTTGDDTYYKQWMLAMPDAAGAADQTRIVTAWDDSAGQATFATRSDTTYTNETYMLIPRLEFTKADLDNALSDRLPNIRRTVMNIIPTVDDERWYSLQKFTWIRSRADVDAVWYRPSPNLIDNGTFTGWGNGTTSAPSAWTAANATITRNARNSNPERVKRDGFSVRLAGSGAAGTLTQSLDPELVVKLRGQSVTLSAQVDAGAATELISITDGLTTTTDEHTGGSTFETLSATHTVAATADTLTFTLQAADGVTGDFDDVKAEEATSINQLLADSGDDGWRRVPVNAVVIDQGGEPFIELQAPKGRRGQLLVYSRQPYPDITSDTANTDCPDDVIIPAVMFELARVIKPKVDREKWDRIERRAATEYARMAGKLIQKPLPRPQTPVVIGSA
jgi:hypothetical protein